MARTGAENSAEWKRNNPERRKILDKAHRDRRKAQGLPHRSVGYYAQLRQDNPEKALLRYVQNRANSTGIPCNLTVEDIRIPTHCPVLGIEIVIGGDHRNNNGPSVDRVEPHKGYVKGNVHVISSKANRLKNNATLAEAKAIVAYIEKHLEEVYNT